MGDVTEDRAFDDGCPLCEAARITPWHHEDDVCWIDKLTGTKRTRQMLEDGESPEAIVAAWRREARRFEVTTKRYRLY